MVSEVRVSNLLKWRSLLMLMRKCQKSLRSSRRNLGEMNPNKLQQTFRARARKSSPKLTTLTTKMTNQLLKRLTRTNIL